MLFYYVCCTWSRVESLSNADVFYDSLFLFLLKNKTSVVPCKQEKRSEEVKHQTKVQK